MAFAVEIMDDQGEYHLIGPGADCPCGCDHDDAMEKTHSPWCVPLAEATTATPVPFPKEDDPIPPTAAAVLTDPRLDGNGLWSDNQSKFSVTSGRTVDLMNLRPEDVNVLDIAHSLSRQCRYNGHVGGFLSVARHSLWVADRMEEMAVVNQNVHIIAARDGKAADRLVALWEMAGLLHDAAEAYIGDLVRPLKHGPEMGRIYKETEAKIEAVIAEVFDIGDHGFPPEVRDADNYVLLERELGGEHQRWVWSSTPDEDEAEFLARFRSLQQRRKH